MGRYAVDIMAKCPEDTLLVLVEVSKPQKPWRQSERAVAPFPLTPLETDAQVPCVDLARTVKYKGKSVTAFVSRKKGKHPYVEDAYCWRFACGVLRLFDGWYRADEVREAALRFGAVEVPLTRKAARALPRGPRRGGLTVIPIGPDETLPEVASGTLNGRTVSITVFPATGKHPENLNWYKWRLWAHGKTLYTGWLDTDEAKELLDKTLRGDRVSEEDL
eukprot:Amastigsp_a343493_11.p1 type:complete len:219 gc:universal Amastigsp_a343493_11:675-19(-)